MNFKDTELKREERAALFLGSLYRKYGYSQYKMSKFEEYDLYVRNKDFLISDSVITFTDTNGKLMALKPDVTLSIIKNSKDDKAAVKKVYYNENVYRISGKSGSYREIMQLGLECIGNVDLYCICEVLTLAAQSLKTISDKCILDVSHMGVVSELLESLKISGEAKREIVACIAEKNVHEASAICAQNGVDEEKISVLKELISLHGAPKDVLPKLYSLAHDMVSKETLDLLSKATEQVEKSGFGDIIRIDFSVINDMKYYNGVVFKGFVSGIPEGVLSGGQYDNLMSRMNKKAGAIGFAVYLDMLEQLSENAAEFDVDVLVLYDDTTKLDSLSALVSKLANGGKRVLAERCIPSKLRYRELVELKEEAAE
ncbi:MAG: hypothetical protein E7539_02390 [Ruminococcaceae bacterium]|nr:hypothetical protein [Oscillospiraceae bacterium]